MTTPSADLVQDALERILASKIFASSPRIRELLRHLVNESLAGRTDRLKGYTIGLDVFDRPETFDPQTDPIVRVQVGRLRQLLEKYYLTEGSGDPVVIEVPRGGYVPTFSAGEPATDSSVAHGGASPPAFHRSIGFITAAIVFVAGTVLAASLWFLADPATNQAGAHAIEAAFDDAGELPKGPSIAVLPLTNLSTDVVQDGFVDGITIQIIVNLTRFRDLFVLGAETTLHLPGTTYDALRAHKSLKVSYIVDGSVRRDGDRIRVTARLLDTRSTRTIWSEAYDRNLSAANMIDLQDDIAGEVAAALGQPHGVIARIEARRAEAGTPENLAAYRCVLRFLAYATDKNVETHREVRDCLEQTTKASPTYARAWASLAYVYGDEYRFGFNRREGQPAIDRAYEAAKRSVALDPSDAVAHANLANAYFNKGKDALFRESAVRALQLNPNDSDVLAAIGSQAALLGDWDRGLPLVEKAIRLNPGHPPWYRGILCLNHYRNGNFDRALEEALAYFQPGLPITYVARIAVYTKLGRAGDAKKLLSELLARFPDFAKDPQRPFRKWRIPADLTASMISALQSAGFRPMT
ncbi:MAG: hypothetical protein ACR2PO_10965 [Methyloligellaceae bacterium]